MPFEFPWTRMRRNAELKKAREIHATLLAHKEQLGRRAATAIEAAMGENPAHRTDNGEVDGMVLRHWPKNCGNYSVMVTMAGPYGWGAKSTFAVYVVDFGIDLSPESTQISLGNGRYGTPETGTLDDFNAFLKKACEMVRDYRYYGKLELVPAA